ncbi:hypothetical protein AALB47_09200 [Lachnospiraceae bacterium 54-11]
MSDKLFRTSIVGGYNKEDVHSYISMLETKLTQAQEKLEEQIELWEKPGKRGSLERDEDVVVLSDTPQEAEKAGKIEEDILKGKQEGESQAAAFDEQARELAAVRQELEKVKSELIDTKVELGISNQRYEQSEQKKESLLELIQRLVENYSGLQTSQYYLAEQVKNIGHMEKRIEMIQNDVAQILRVDVSMSDSFER